MVELKNLYLLISYKVMTDCLNNEDNIFYCYYADRKRLLIAPVSATYFSKLHKSAATFLKLRNSEGTRSFQLTNVFLDHPEIEEHDRVLAFESNPNTNLLTVYL